MPPGRWTARPSSPGTCSVRSAGAEPAHSPATVDVCSPKRTAYATAPQVYPNNDLATGGMCEFRRYEGKTGVALKRACVLPSNAVKCVRYCLTTNVMIPPVFFRCNGFSVATTVYLVYAPPFVLVSWHAVCSP
jgi:hypothetical protein